MGGMTTASLLSNIGYKVLVLEQHYLPGGFTHMFGRKGFKWDVGVHAIGNVLKDPLSWMINTVSKSDKKVELVSLGNPYDQVFFPKDVCYDMLVGIKNLIENLKRIAPEQSKNID